MSRTRITIRIPTRDWIAAWLARQDLGASPGLAEKIAGYLELLARWNRKISLTAIREPELILERHFGEAFSAVKAVPIIPGKLVDIGSGAGFPAIPAKLIVPAMAVTLVESNQKKCAFLKEVTQRLELTDVRVVAERLENLRPAAFSADFVTCRAVGQFKKLLEWSRKVLGPEGQIILWLGREAVGRIEGKGGWIWREVVPLPKSKERVLLVGRPRFS